MQCRLTFGVTTANAWYKNLIFWDVKTFYHHCLTNLSEDNEDADGQHDDHCPNSRYDQPRLNRCAELEKVTRCYWTNLIGRELSALISTNRIAATYWYCLFSNCYGAKESSFRICRRDWHAEKSDHFQPNNPNLQWQSHLKSKFKPLHF